MRWRGAAIIGIGALALTAAVLAREGAPGDAGLGQQRQQLAAARRAAAAAATRADALTAQATDERDAAAHARAQAAATAARVEQAEAELDAGRERVALVARLLADRRAELATGEAPVARLLGALASLARRPALASLAQPGSLDDLVHLRAIFGAVAPAIRARTAGLRDQVAATRRLQGDAELAAGALDASRDTLERRRRELAALEAQHQGRAADLARSALSEGDRALALGEQARDIADRLAESGGQQATVAELATLAGPPAPTMHPVAAAPAYRLPAQGRLVSGFGEISPAGVRSRGLTLAVAAGDPVSAPAGGRIVYARRFRHYGPIVILDHGAGWTSLVTGLDALAVRAGETVAAGAPLGTAAAGAAPQVTVELRRRGRPVDVTALL